MDRQQVSRWLPLLVLVLAACDEDLPYEGAFDLPTAAAVLQPETGGPFQEPVGFVANGVGGNVVTLDLKSGRFLTTTPTASFLRSPWVPTGEARMLAAVAPYAPGGERAGEVTLFVGDRGIYDIGGERVHGLLLRVPYIVGVDDEGFPIEGWVDDGTILGEPIVREQDSVLATGDVQITDIELKDGWTATETWTVEFEPQRGVWFVTGSRSGLQEDVVVAGERFVGDRRRIAFTLEGQGQPGDVLEIVTDNGVRELDVGGVPHELKMAPDQSVLAMSVGVDALERSVLELFDPATESVVAVPELAPDASAGRLAWAPDGASVFVSDTARPAVWEVSADGAVVTEHVMPWPVIDVAPLYGLEFGRLLHVVPFFGDEVWVYDLDAGAFRDVNTAVPGVQGMSFLTPVLGIEAIPQVHLYRDVNDDGVRRSGRSVAVSLHEGAVVFMEEATGCLQRTALGPRTAIDGTLGVVSDVSTNFDDIPFAAFLQENIGNDRNVVVNPCAGIAREESWSLRFDRNLAAWIVEGAITGEQESLAFEDERYLSDRGEISFVVRAGSVPSQENWQMTFSVLDGVLTANGDNDGDGEPDVPFEVPGDPVFFHYVVGPTEGAWKLVDDRAFVLVPAQASDLVGRVDPQEGDVEVRWD